MTFHSCDVAGVVGCIVVIIRIKRVVVVIIVIVVWNVVVIVVVIIIVVRDSFAEARHLLRSGGQGYGRG